MNVSPSFALWHHLAVELGFTDFLTAEDGFRCCLPNGERWGGSQSCGVYFWIADDGETYVGQTVNSRARLREHQRRHPDLRYAAFQRVAQADLTSVECKLIEEAGRRFPTRNIKHALDTQAHVPFDRFVGDDERAAFLAGRADLPDLGWHELPLSAQKQAKTFARIAGEADYREVLRALNIYVGKVIPRPAATEGRLWSVSLYVQCHLLRVNGGQQEVFTVQTVDGRLYARPLTLEPFGPEASGPWYRTGSFDAFVPVENLARWLSGARLRSCRELVVRLMRHTTTLNSGSHCPQIVRAAFAG